MGKPVSRRASAVRPISTSTIASSASPSSAESAAAPGTDFFRAAIENENSTGGNSYERGAHLSPPKAGSCGAVFAEPCLLAPVTRAVTMTG